MTTTDLEPVTAPAMTLWRSDDQDQIVQQATQVADMLAKVIHEQRLTVKIGSGKPYVLFEGWTLLGTLLGVQPYVVWSRRIDDFDGANDGWEARAEARTLDGRTISAAEAQCTREERTWKNRDSYAIRSMAQTRASAKAMRLPLGFVMSLAGFDPTPADEMPADYVSPPKRIVLDPGIDLDHDEPGPDFGPIQDASLEQAEGSAFRAPAQRPDDTGQPPATERQRKAIWTLMTKLSKTGQPKYELDTMRRWMGAEFGTEDPGELYRNQASELLDRLTKRLEQEGLK